MVLRRRSLCQSPCHGLKDLLLAIKWKMSQSLQVCTERETHSTSPYATVTIVLSDPMDIGQFE